MKLIRYINGLGAIICLALTTSPARAGEILNFQAMAEPGGTYGESIWSTFTYVGSGFQLDVTATESFGDPAYVYLDAGNAGMGVCDAPNLYTNITNKLNSATNSNRNLCKYSSDDNVSWSEALSFVFNVDVLIEDIWFNNNHDVDQGLYTDSINIDGSVFTFNTDNGGPANYSAGTSFLVGAGTPFDVSYNNEQFYVSGMEVSVAVPEPSALALLGLGLLGLTLSRKRI